MLDPRIYRTGLIVVAVAVIVVAFSLGNQASPLNATLVPDAFNGQHRLRDDAEPRRRSIPTGRRAPRATTSIADYVASVVQQDGLQVQRTVFTAQTVDGPRTIQTVTGTLAGLIPGSIVIVAHRDSTRTVGGRLRSCPGPGCCSSWPSDLSAQTQQRSVVLASTSASVGAAGAAQLARTPARSRSTP